MPKREEVRENLGEMGRKEESRPPAGQKVASTQEKETKRKGKPISQALSNQFPDSGGIIRFRRRRFEISKFDKVEITGRVNFF